MKEQDEEIIAAMRSPARRESGFALLVRTHQERLYGHLRRMLGNHPDADDALQNALIKVWKNFDRFRGDAALYTWLFRIATNEALTLIEKRKQTGHHLPVDHIPLRVVRDGPDGEEIERRLAAALEMLPPKQRQVFDLKYFEELTYEEMAAITGTTVGALKASYFHAVKKIESALKAT